MEVVSSNVKDFVPTLNAVIPLSPTCWISDDQATFAARDLMLLAIPVTNTLPFCFLDCNRVENLLDLCHYLPPNFPRNRSRT